MYNRHYKRYKMRRNPNSGSQLIRKNPGSRLPPNYYSDYEPEEAKIIKFENVSAARAFLIANFEELTIPDPDDPSNKHKRKPKIIKDEIDKLKDRPGWQDDPATLSYLEFFKQAQLAEKLCRDADKRNLRRQVTSMAGRGRDKRKTQYHDELGRVDPRKILDYGHVAEILAKYYGKNAIPQFLKWCGVIKELDDYEDHPALVKDLDEILQRKCSQARGQEETPYWQDMACNAYEECPSEERSALPLQQGRILRRNITEGYYDYGHEDFDYDENPDEYDEYEENPDDEYDEYEENPDKLHLWEEAVGPGGELIRFYVNRYDSSSEKAGQIKAYERVNPKKVSPKNGDLILDMTCGIKVSKQTSEGRIDLPPDAINAEMRSNYKNSFLYKVRLVAAEKETPKNFVKLCFDMLYRKDREALLEELNRVHGAARKRSMKKRKNRKK